MHFDILDPQLYASDPFPVYQWLRDNAPLYRDEKNKLWIVSKYEDVAYVSKHPRLFCSGQGVTPDSDTAISIVTMDDPRHSQLRGIVSRGFTPRMVSQLEARIREVTIETIDAVVENGSCDFVTDIAMLIPLLVIAEMIGIRREDREAFGHWSDTMIAAAGQQNNMEVVQKAATSYIEYSTYLQGVFEERRREPRNDLVSVLIAAQDEGLLAADDGNLSADELLQFMTILLVAGNETTRNAMSGGMLALAENPTERARLQAHPELLPTAVEEIIRWVTPVVGFRRTVTQDTILRGQSLVAGDRVLMLYQSANRDDDAFSEPNSFRVDRHPNEHLAFGIGTHFCLGANLARLELRIAFEEIFRRLPDIDVAPGARAVRPPSVLVRSISGLPVTFTPQERSDREAPAA
jgi:cytochrome P450 family 142 subfamily A polypeptide 1